MTGTKQAMPDPGRKYSIPADLEAFMRTKSGQRGRVSGRGPVMTLEDFLDIKPLGEGKMVVRCTCGHELCRGWAEIYDDEPWGHRPWEAPVDFIGPLERDFSLD